MPPRKRKSSSASTASTQQRVSKRQRRSESGDSSRLKADEPSGLEKLPDEVLLLIFEELKEDEDLEEDEDLDYPVFYKNYYNLCITSKRLNRVANECLYKEFVFGPNSAPKFLRTIIANPELGDRVKGMQWSLSRSLYPEENLQRRPTSNDCRLLRESLKRLNIDRASRPQWHDKYTSSDWSALLEVALLHIPNLQELDAIDDTPSAHRSPTTRHTTRHLQLFVNAGQAARRRNEAGVLAGREQPLHFEHLQRLTISLGNWQIHRVQAILHLPALRWLDIHQADVYTPDVHCTDIDDFIPEREPFSGLTHLEVTGGFSTSNALAMFIRSCRALKEVSVVRSMPPTVISDYLDYAPIADALQQHKDSLEKFDFKDVYDEVHFDVYNHGHFHSFHDFTKLKHLAIAFKAFPIATNRTPTVEEVDFMEKIDGFTTPLHLHEYLPPSLQELRLCLYSDEEDDHHCSTSLLYYTHRCKAHQPKLCVVDVELCDYQTFLADDHEGFMSENYDFFCVQSRFTSLGIHFSFDNDAEMYGDHGNVLGVDETWDEWDEEYNSEEEEELLMMEFMDQMLHFAQLSQVSGQVAALQATTDGLLATLLGPPGPPQGSG